MKLTTQYFEDTSKGQYTTADDDSMVTLFNKLEELAGQSHLKIYWRIHHNYKDNCEMVYIYGVFPKLQHEVTLANACGSGRRIWLEHHLQRFVGEAVSPIFVFSDAQIEAFDRLFAKWLLMGTDVTEPDAAVAEDIMGL